MKPIALTAYNYNSELKIQRKLFYNEIDMMIIEIN
jgi:hypothetical protein